MAVLAQVDVEQENITNEYIPKDYCHLALPHELNDVINHPSHYTQGSVECIDAMESAFGAAELAVYCKIAAFKYIWRCERKNGSEDIKKAVWYLKKYLELKDGEAHDSV